MTQMSLFETREPPSAPLPLRFHVPIEKVSVKHPFGKPDKKGMYAYEKLHKEIEKLPEMYQERFNDLTIEMPVNVKHQFLACFKLFANLNDQEMLDFDESRGRL